VSFTSKAQRSSRKDALSRLGHFPCLELLMTTRVHLLLLVAPMLLGLPALGHAAASAASNNEDVTQDHVVVFSDMRNPLAATARRSSLASRAQALGGQIKTSMGSIDAAVVRMTPRQARSALAAGRVVAVEPLRTLSLRDMVPPPAPATLATNAQVRPMAIQASVASVGLDRVDQAFRPLDSAFSYTSTGSNVNVYVIDSGIRPSHSDLSGRVFQDWPANNAADCDGHGTKVAGSLGGAQSGVAKQARLRSVRIFDCNGNTTNATYIEAINWITSNHQKPAVVNASLTTSARSPATEAAIRNSIVSGGVLWVIAAGNANRDACTNAEPNVAEALRVGVTIPGTDARVNIPNWYGSNFGSCVDIFAPGHGVTTSANTSDTAFELAYGTSLAAPLVTGAAALYLEKNPSATPSQVKAAILGRSTHGQAFDIGAGSPNRLLYWPGSGSWDLQTAGNISGSGRSDLIWRNYRTGELAFWNVNGASIVSSGFFYTLNNVPEWRIEGTGDFNNDGRPDLLWRNYSTGELAVWYMGLTNGSIALVSGQFMTPTVADTQWRVEAVADLNGDGKVDFLWRNYASGQIAYWYMNDRQLISSGFAETVSDTAWRIEGAGDFNGDGKADWVWRNYSTGEIGYWYMNGPTRIGSAILSLKVPSSWRIDAVADMNSDGRPDFVWRNYATGENAVWIMNNTSLASSYFLTTVAD
jgi:subtilisin family serine protease